jgi:endonuclease/exonuclease/phosphatase (EEP) superfamily protein YafD
VGRLHGVRGGMINRSEISGLVTGFGLVLAAVLFACSKDLGLPGQDMLQTIRFHLAIFMAGIVVLLLMTGAWRRSLFFLLIGLISAGEGAWFIARQQMPRAEIASLPTETSFTVLSFNVLMSNVTNGDEIAEMLKASGADVVVLMEARPLYAYVRQLAETYPYKVGCDDERGCDLMLMSKTELTHANIHSLSRFVSNRLITAKTVIGGEQIDLVAAHLSKPYFDSVSDTEVGVMSRFLNRETEGAMVMAGDFNAAAWSKNLLRMVRFNELMPGPWYPGTWPVELGPLAIPIDNMFTRSPAIIEEISATPDSHGSNHRGLIAKVAIKGTQSAL